MATDDGYKPGDRVAEYRGGATSTAHVVTIERLTDTQYVLTNGRRYRRDTNRLVGDHYGGELLPLDNARVRVALTRYALTSLRVEIDAKLKNLTGDRDAALVAIGEIDQILREHRARIENL